MLNASLTLRQNRYPDAAARTAAFERITTTIGEMPAVQSVALTNAWPVQQPNLAPLSTPDASRAGAQGSIHGITPSYFDTLGISLAAGRPFAEHDRAGSEPVAIVSASLARRLWPDGSALGAIVTVPQARERADPVPIPRRVIGIASDVRQGPADEELADVYVPMLQARPHRSRRLAQGRLGRLKRASIYHLPFTIQAVIGQWPGGRYRIFTARSPFDDDSAARGCVSFSGGAIMKATIDSATAAVRSDARFCFARMPDGTRLRYFRQGPPDGPAVLLLHGLSDSSFSFSRILPLVPPHVQAIALDQRGHGESDRPAAGYELAGMAWDALHVLDAAQVNQALVVGHSMGSYVARVMAALAPQRVASLVLIDPGPGTNAVLQELWGAVARLNDPVDPAFVREFQESCIRRPVPPEFMDLVVQESLKLPAVVWRAALAGMMAYEPVEDRVSCPTLVLGGDQDAVFSVDEMTAVARAITNARVRMLEGIGHTPHWEDPRTTIGILLEELSPSQV